MRLIYFAFKSLKDMESSEDIVSTLFCNLASETRQFETMEKLTAFLFISVKNRCLKHIAHLKVVSRREKGITYLIDTSIEDHGAYMEAQEVRTRLLFAIYEEIEKLPKARRDIIKMSYIQECSTEEMCKALNMSRESVYNNRLKAIKQLRRLLISKKLLCFMILLENI